MKPRILPETDPRQPKTFTFSADNQDKIDAILTRYPEGRQKSAIMPLLDLAQRQMAKMQTGLKDGELKGGWIPRAAMDEIARILDVTPMQVYEVATFYTMYRLTPTGEYHVQVCTTTPCWLRGSDALMNVCKTKLGAGHEGNSDDGKFTVTEVECLGACVNAPMVQINDHYYEDLTPERLEELLAMAKAGEELPQGSQIGRNGSQAKSKSA